MTVLIVFPLCFPNHSFVDSETVNWLGSCLAFEFLRFSCLSRCASALAICLSLAFFQSSLGIFDHFFAVARSNAAAARLAISMTAGSQMRLGSHPISSQRFPSCDGHFSEHQGTRRSVQSGLISRVSIDSVKVVFMSSVGVRSRQRIKKAPVKSLPLKHGSQIMRCGAR